MALSNWEADKMLDVYIYDYLIKKKLHATAKSFMTEGKVAPDPFVTLTRPMSSEGVALAAKMYEERMKHPNPIDSETSQPLLDARMALLKSATNHSE
ncbi:hypothetical protein CsatB_028611 [Cannabis sativa]